MLNFHQLVRWATKIISREMQSELYGSITFNLQKGSIVNVEVKRSEKPALDELTPG